MKKKDLQKVKKRVFRNLDLFLISIAVIMIWRGVWNLIDVYFVPDFRTTSNILSIVIGIIILFLHNFDLRDL